MTVRAYVTFDDPLIPAHESGTEAGPTARSHRDADTLDRDRGASEATPPGGGLAEELARGLEAEGLTRVLPVSRWEDYGWEFTVRVDGRDVWFMLQSSDRWLLISDARRSFTERLRGTHSEEPHAKALTMLAAVFARSRFANVRWFTRDEFERSSPGTETPLG